MVVAQADACFALIADKNGFQQQLKPKQTHPGNIRKQDSQEMRKEHLQAEQAAWPPSTHSVSREHSATWPSPVVKGRLGSRWGCGEGATGRKEDQGAMCSAANPSQVTEAGGLGTKLMGTSKHGALWG